MTKKSTQSVFAATADDPSGPKTARPDANDRGAAEPPFPADDTSGPKLDAMPDRIDARDWFYRPGLAPLPDVVVNCDRVPAILHQGSEGACTGFALAAVINFLLANRASRAAVSPRMLYEMARRYDEWPGENYDGSSARGAMKGWMRHGVCSEDTWPVSDAGPDQLTEQRAEEAKAFQGGAFYRVNHGEVRDVHAALADIGIVFMTLMVHSGWDRAGPETCPVRYYEGGSIRTREFPVITRTGRADRGHAVAIVGYTDKGFIIQNSWGDGWGAGGFALLPYEDFLLHAVDLWVAQLGVPITANLWANSTVPDATVGMGRAAAAVPLADIRPYVIDVGNDGLLSLNGDYWTTEADLNRLFTEHLPGKTADWPRKRVMLYLHGGLNDERAVARRIVAMRDVCMANQIYPLHIMWESGAMETVGDILDDLTHPQADRAAAAWLDDLRDRVREARDMSIELTTARAGGTLWRKMKENARLSSQHKTKRGAMQLLARHARDALAALEPGARDAWEFHVVSHSAGAIYGAYALEHMTTLGGPLASFQMMAPALTTALFREAVMPYLKKKTCPVPDTYILSDPGERDDRVGPYGKSLLYLVSNAFEKARDTPIVGMERYVHVSPPARNEHLVDRDIEAILKPALVIAAAGLNQRQLASQSDSHGGFDNDPVTMTSVLRRILGAEPARPFTTRDLQF